MSAAGINVATFVLTVLANGLWQAALLAGAAWLVLRIAPGASATTRHAVLVAALIGAIVLPVVTTAAAFVRPATTQPATTAAIEGTKPIEYVPQQRVAVRAPAHVIQRTPSIASATAALETKPAVAPLRPHVTLPPLVVTVLATLWAVCAVALVVRLVLSLLYLERLKRDALPLSIEYRTRLERWDEAGKGTRDVRLCRSPEVTVPIAVGIFDAMILIPERLLEELPAEDLDRVLLHELAHLRRGDDWINALERVAEALFFFNPAIRWIVRQLDVEREVACDDWVLGRRSEALPYAQCLVKLVESIAWPHQPMVAPGVFVTRRSLSIRIERLLAKQRDVRLRISLGPLSAVAAVVVAVCLLGAYVAPSIAASALSANNATNGTTPLVSHARDVSRAPAQAASPHKWHSTPAVVAQASPQPTPVPSTEPAATPVPSPGPSHAAGASAAVRSRVAVSTATKLQTTIVQHETATLPSAIVAQTTGEAASSTAAPSTVAMSNGDYISEMAEAGYPNLSVDDLIRMKSLGVTPDFVRQMAAAGFTRPTVDQLVQMRALGLSPEYVHEIRKIFPNAPLSDLLSMKAVGVTPDYVAELRAAGITPLTAENVRSMRAVGVTRDYIANMRSAGVTGLTGDSLRSMRAVGVDAAYLRELNAAGYSVHDAQTLTQLRAVGVDKAFIDSVHSHGFHNLTIDQLVRLRTSGVLDQ